MYTGTPACRPDGWLPYLASATLSIQLCPSYLSILFHSSRTTHILHNHSEIDENTMVPYTTVPPRPAWNQLVLVSPDWSAACQGMCGFSQPVSRPKRCLFLLGARGAGLASCANQSILGPGPIRRYQSTYGRPKQVLTLLFIHHKFFAPQRTAL